MKAGGSSSVIAQTINLIALQNTVYHYQMDENWGFYASGGSQTGSASVSVGWKDEKTTSSTLEGLAQVSSLQAAATSPSTPRAISTRKAPSWPLRRHHRERGRRHQPDRRLRHLHGHEQQEFHADRAHAVGQRECLKRHQYLRNAGKDFNAGQGSDANKKITQGSEALNLSRPPPT